MNVLITGATGLIGSALTPFLTQHGHRLIALQRGKPAQGSQPFWNPKSRTIDLQPAGPIEGVIHLAGENIAQRWSRNAKARIRESRIDATQLLVDALLQQPARPKVLLCASATGFYGNRGNEILDEQSRSGQGFLAEICRDWEAATEPASRAGMRVVHLRFGIVLSGRGGALKKMSPAFRFGLGGKLGNGQQYWSWIAIDDVVSAVEFTLRNGSLHGPVNIVGPNPAPNAEFTKTLARVLKRPAIFSVPAFAIKLLMGEMGEEALLSSFRVTPAVLQAQAFRFRYPELENALKHVLAC